VNRTEISTEIRTRIAEMCEVDAASIREESLLQEDLDLDSIDAIDLVVKLQEYTGRKISPSEFKKVRTIGDVVDKIYAQVNNGANS
jgi:acyl carrier protein